MSVNIEEQIKTRLQHDEDVFSDAFVSLSEVITERELFGMFSESRKETSDEALEELLAFYGFKMRVKVPASVTDPEEYLDYVLNPTGIMRRAVTLNQEWYKNAFGAFLVVLDDAYTAALIPSIRGYQCISPGTGERFTVTKKNAGRIGSAAICFYSPLPEKSLTLKDMVKHVASAVEAGDILKIMLFSAVLTLVTMLTPYITRYLFDNVALQMRPAPLYSVFVLIICTYIATAILRIGKGLAVFGISDKADAVLSSSIMMRVLNLPPSFFKKYTAGNLYSTIEYSKQIASSFILFIFDIGIALLMSILYIIQIWTFSPLLAVPSFIIAASLAVFSVISFLFQKNWNKEIQQTAAEEYGFLISMMNGIQKIRLSGSEKRLFSQWADIYKERAQLTYNPPVILKHHTTFTTFLTLAGSFLLYFCALRSKIDPAVYMGFMASYGLLSAAFLNLSESMPEVSAIKAQLEQLQPILEEVPESASTKRTVKQLSGRIDVNKVSFRYMDSQPRVINRLSLSVKPGEYIGIVGKSGCGKSTLMRLLLGFEKPQRGSVSYDSIDLNSLEPRSLRRQIGCVLQDEGLFTDSIRANITLTNPFATDEEVWEAARLAGIEEDIKAMPMGMKTLVFDSSGTISGGQKQRILIARALIGKPNILFFDEATSALDNNTQKIITDTLASLDCTRIVIAHRLSTVRQCDRIVMMENGQIIEEGTYDELMERKGRFAELVERQLM